MSAITDIVTRFRGVKVEQALGLRPPYPPVALELDGDRVRLVRLKRRRRGVPLLEAQHTITLDEPAVPASIFEPMGAGAGNLLEQIRGLFESSGTRPGNVSLIFPDNLAKVSLVQLPERPASARQLDELVKAKMRRAVPFRLEEARLAYEMLAGPQREVSVLVTVVRNALVERFESTLETLGARAGLIDICTPNLINLCHERIAAVCEGGGDAALLNCTDTYFTLVIVREGRVIFFRCKSFVVGDESRGGRHGMLVREVGNSLAYYREKLDGEGIHGMFVRSVDIDVDELVGGLESQDCGQVSPITPSGMVDLAQGVRLDSLQGQQILPGLGAAAGRS